MLLNFSISNFGFGQMPEATWRCKAAYSRMEAVSEFITAAQDCSYERLELWDDDGGWMVAVAIRYNDGRIEVTVHPPQ